MKYLILYLLLLGSVSNAATFHCNPVVYDEIYRAIIINAIKTKSGMASRNLSIRMLRNLCFGQKSSYEVPNELKGDIVYEQK